MAEDTYGLAHRSVLFVMGRDGYQNCRLLILQNSTVLTVADYEHRLKERGVG